MRLVSFRNQLQYDFAEAFLQGAKACSFDVQFYPEKLEIQVSHTTIGRLLERTSNSQPVVLPYCGKKMDHWMITGASRRSLDQTLARASRFVVPSYAEFANESRVPQLKRFDPDKNMLQQLGDRLYRVGYYNWQSPVKYREIILDRLELWLDLEAKQPSIRSKQISTYHNLHQAFQSALAVENWSEAEICLHEMQRLNLSTADNLMFLRIQLLAQQQEWCAIWEHSSFEIIARLRMPRAVRAAMLTAFYHTELLPLEQEGDWQTAFNVFKEERRRLGTLLTGRFGLIEGTVVRVFGYQALFDGDRDSIAQLKAEEIDPQTRKCLETLEKLLPLAPEPSEPPADPLVQARLALAKDDYETAIRISESIKDIAARTLLLTEIAFHSSDAVVIEKALRAYQELSSEQQKELRSNRRYVGSYLDFLRKSAAPPPFFKQTAPDVVTSSTQLCLEPIWTPSEAAAREAAWNAICELEARLRRLIEARYQTRYGEDWMECVNQEMRQTWAEARAKDERTFARYGQPAPSLLDYSYLGDLLALINAEWALFQDVFGTGKTAKRQLQGKIEDIIRVRNPLAHNRAVPENELKRAEVYCTDVLMLLQKVSEDSRSRL